LFYVIFINMKKIIRLTERDLTRIVKQVIREFDYEPHKNKDLEIIDRFIISINPGSDDVIEIIRLLKRLSMRIIE
jgi:hypothetical protein